MTEPTEAPGKEQKMETLELGISQEELREQIINRAAERLVEHFVHEDDARAAMDSIVRDATKAVVEQVASETVEPLVQGQIEEIALQRTNQWGEAQGEAVTFTEYLVQRAERYMVEPVNYKGETKAEARGMGWNHRDTQARLAYMIDKHLQYSIKTAVEDALKNLNTALGQSLANTVKIHLRQVLDKLKVEVKT